MIIEIRSILSLMSTIEYTEALKHKMRAKFCGLYTLSTLPKRHPFNYSEHT